MGEAKRRKKLDPNFGKVRKQGRFALKGLKPLSKEEEEEYDKMETNYYGEEIRLGFLKGLVSSEKTTANIVFEFFLLFWSKQKVKLYARPVFSTERLEKNPEIIEFLALSQTEVNDLHWLATTELKKNHKDWLERCAAKMKSCPVSNYWSYKIQKTLFCFF